MASSALIPFLKDLLPSLVVPLEDGSSSSSSSSDHDDDDHDSHPIVQMMDCDIRVVGDNAITSSRQLRK
jgi:hypothetical protein